MATVPSPATTSSRQELIGLTAWRGVAAVLVVIYHLEGMYRTQMDASLALGPFTDLVQRGDAFVDLFFILSGFVMAYVYGQRTLFESGALKRFLLLRVGRIYPLHLFVVALLGLRPLGAFLAGERPVFSDHSSPSSLITELLMLDSLGLHDRLTWNEVSWSVSAEWISYLLAPALLLIARRGKLSVSAAVVLLAVLWLGVWSLENDAGRLGWATYNFGWLRGILGFCIGVCAYRIHDSGLLLRWQRQRGAVVVSGASMYLIITFASHDALLTPAFIALILTSIESSGTEARLLEARPMRWLGDISYSTYMLQQVLLLVALNGFASFASDLSPMSLWLVSGAWLAALLLISTLTYRAIEVPARDAVRARVRTKSKPANARLASAAKPVC